MLLCVVLAAAVVWDLRWRRIPNALTAAGAVGAVALGGSLAAGAAACGLLGACALARPGGMGLGDAKLAGVMGLCLGPAVFGALLAACVACVGYGAALAVVRGVAVARRAAVPFAPFLAFGAVVVVGVAPPGV